MAFSTALLNSSLVVYRRAATFPLMPPTRNCPEWYGQDYVVAISVVPGLSVNHGQSIGLRNVPSKGHECKKRKMSVLHRVQATRLPWFPSLRTEVWAVSPTLPRKMPCSRGHLKSKGQSDNVMTYPPLSSHAVEYVPATACHGDSPLTRTPHFCRSHCDNWHSHHRKEPLERNTAWVVAPIQCRHPTVHSRKSGDTTSLSSLSSYGLNIIDRGIPISDYRFRVDFVGECRMDRGAM